MVYVFINIKTDLYLTNLTVREIYNAIYEEIYSN